MTSQPIRDQVEDHLITPKNAALLIIDYQPPQVSSIVSMDHRTLVSNIVATARLAKLYALPIVLSTVNVKTGLSALWTEACLSFPALDALREGYEVYPVVDAVGGTSVEAHRAGRQSHRAGWRTTHQRGSTDV